MDLAVYCILFVGGVIGWFAQKYWPDRQKIVARVKGWLHSNTK